MSKKKLSEKLTNTSQTLNKLLSCVLNKRNCIFGLNVNIPALCWCDSTRAVERLESLMFAYQSFAGCFFNAGAVCRDAFVGALAV